MNTSNTLPKHERIAKAIADRWFKDMQNPEYQGAAFTWDRFPLLVQGRVEADLFLYYAHLPKNFDNLKAQTGKYAFEYATQLVDAHRDTLVVVAKKKPQP